MRLAVGREGKADYVTPVSWTREKPERFALSAEILGSKCLAFH